jgi:coproporphyrinogen III oxidase
MALVAPLSKNFHEAETLYRRIQSDLIARYEAIDGGRFDMDAWDRPGGGGGLTRVLSDGIVFEKAAVNVSAVQGPAPKNLTEHLGVEASWFGATGVSLILHPQNPYIPTMHANLRYFETDTGAAWCGGGADLTPYYFFEQDALLFHRILSETCQRHAAGDYQRWKTTCDEYFWLPHRGESRGIGGIFFDHETDVGSMLALQSDLGSTIADAYLPIVDRHKESPYGEPQERWQHQRRGRYVEFNLIHDQGTRFGLQTDGRTESILVSLPPRVRFDYNAVPSLGSPEQGLIDVLTSPPRTWIT